MLMARRREAMVAFAADRIGGQRAKRKETGAMGRTLRIETALPGLRAKIILARKQGWGKWLSLKAGVILTPEETNEFISEGH